MMYRFIKELVLYGIRTGLMDESEEIYARNLLLDLMKERSYEEPEEARGDMPLAEILEGLLDIAEERGITGDTVTERDLFDTKLMNCLTPRPAQVTSTFKRLYGESPETATGWYYKFSQDTNYIRRDRAKKDLRWKAESEYGEIDVTINLAKPEKDPKAIAAAGKLSPSGYPACQLCRENEGYAGHAGYPARQTHRVIPIDICGQKWSWQYSPYGYYNEHCIAFNDEHIPMKVDRSCFEKILDFVSQYPHYFMGSNADLPIVGGSILAHEHFQGGRYDFAMAKSPIKIPFTVPGFEDVESGIVKWPLSVFRLRCSDRDRLAELADRVLTCWRGYTDKEAFIYAETEGEKHNTITPIARKSGAVYELDLVLRNNITTEERPLGVYHPAPEYHHIKKENIGLIEVMGLAVLPSRLKREMQELGDLIAAGRKSGKGDEEIAEEINERQDLAVHGDWAKEILRNYEEIDGENVQGILQTEIGRVFVKVLEDAGVFKWNQEGHNAFLRFLEGI
ncbi:MAG: UDP-glucose--hexose-1-phosphate uridylyltransferase [Firmicutes bacterium]|nr:UDP-glucose--hexose-1-phosphate uridylyltransferase [Bacillota bacterium]